MPVRPLLVFGTRPEAIKMAPVVRACHQHNGIAPIVCLTGQHREMLDQVNSYFNITADDDLQVMSKNQTLATLTSKCITGIDSLIERHEPDCVVAQGDTTTVMAASMVSFYRRIPFVHVEAGLRTGNMQAPWPEEFNRRVVGLTAGLHCAPTETSAQNLLKEGTPAQFVHVTGNTVIDALLHTVEKERANNDQWDKKYSDLSGRKMVLITGHRRENFGGGFENLCHAIRTLAEQFTDTVFCYPVHLNPNVREPVNTILGETSNVLLTEPAPYPEFVWLMDRAHVILTDSGGVQEEAPSLKKPILVMRDTTERPEALEAGAVELVGTDRDRIVERVSLLLTNETEYASRQIDENPYGDGKASQRIADLLANRAWEA
ncbi:MAG: non-hydrolyzing UDP-N-acetylglucosamine 2-epimerase [Planctomycetaceae bacterium]